MLNILTAVAGVPLRLLTLSINTKDSKLRRSDSVIFITADSPAQGPASIWRSARLGMNK